MAKEDSKSKAKPTNTSSSDGEGKLQEDERDDIAASAAPTVEGEDLVTASDKQDVEAQDVQEQVEEHEKSKPLKFGTFGGVFVPTLLTILGVIMYLRTGWVVGNAGFGGAVLIVLIAFLITGCTGLSMSSFVTNIRVGAGGAFSMISQSLGIEVGGAIGVPLYVSQALAVVMYIFGFREGWLWIFPDHPAILIDITVFAVIMGITLISTALAFRVQYAILAIIIVSLFSVAGAAAMGSMEHSVTWWGEFPGASEEGFSGSSFWLVFAVFFPASTGIMAGANMSGELGNPRKSIPVGTMSAIGLSLMVYLVLTYWLATSATTEELLNNYTIMIDRAYWGPPVLAGLLAATFSSALASFVGAPRILQALGVHNIISGGSWFSARTAKGEPRNAMFITGGLVLIGLLVRDLNSIAPLITMIFLITYTMINFIVFIEQTLGLISFRPTLRVPRIVPLVGLVGCVFVMFIIDATVSLIAMVLIVMLYFVLMHRQLKSPFGDVRSGLFEAVAEWAAKRVKMMRGTAQRAWKPNILLPTDDARRLAGLYRLVHDLAYPVGSVKLLGVAESGNVDVMQGKIIESQVSLQQEGVFASSAVVEAKSFSDAIVSSMQTLSGAFFRPNVLLLELPADKELHQSLSHVIDEAHRERLGVALIVEHDEIGLGRRKRINLWLPDRSPDWEMQMEFENLDLAILLAYRLWDSWKGELTMIQTVNNKKDQKKAEQFLERLSELARLPGETKVLVAEGEFNRYSSEAPQADLNIFPLPDQLDPDFLWSLRDSTNASCLFTRDSGLESALA